MKITANEIRVGMLLEYKNDLWQVLKTQHVKPGKGGAFAQVEMKSLNKNTNFKATISLLKFVKKITRIPIVAIGGINNKNYKKLLLNKANFLAISGYIWNNKKFKPEEAIKKYR